ncbi:twin-arginine translocase TatA/TatE family subunit [Archaeoglobales archaeon]|nr:MAG: twin-arginine translocase TatA/TatE family subunit [Archaeoglobales archaeon]
MIGGIGPNELMIILAIIALLFGASKIPELARNLGRAKTEYKKGELEGELEIQKMREEFKDKDLSRDRLEYIARTLDIDPVGKTDEELRKEISIKLGVE